jgi:hypothetical protein
MAKKTLEEFLGGFGRENVKTEKVREGKPVTIWIPKAAKAEYDRLQRASERDFGKRVREIIIATIEEAKTRTA